MAREMKDSGVAWIGEIPADWDVLPLKRLCSMQAGKNLISEQIKLSGEYPVYGGNGLRGYFDEFNNDGEYLLVGRQGALCGNVHRVAGRFWATEHAIVTSTSPLAKADFLYYLLTAMDLNQYASDVAAQPGLSVNSILNVKTCSTSFAQQKRIAAFLDRKCAEIDVALDKTRTSIEEYKKLKQAIITQAVTKGVRGDRPMKESGIEWIGAIPENWDVRRIKSIGTYRNGLTYAPEDQADESGTLVLRSSNVQNGKLDFSNNVFVSCEVPAQLMVQKGDILICSRNGSRELIGKSAIIDSDICASFGAFMMIFRCECPGYMYYLLNSNIFSVYLNTFLTTTINQLTGKNFGNMNVVYCPDAVEQDEIVSFLDRRCLELDELIAKKISLINSLESYKKSLIYEYVTGKKEVH